jgi:hypothetical protein
VSPAGFELLFENCYGILGPTIWHKIYKMQRSILMTPEDF